MIIKFKTRARSPPDTQDCTDRTGFEDGVQQLVRCFHAAAASERMTAGEVLSRVMALACDYRCVSVYFGVFTNCKYAMSMKGTCICNVESTQFQCPPR